MSNWTRQSSSAPHPSPLPVQNKMSLQRQWSPSIRPVHPIRFTAFDSIQTSNSSNQKMDTFLWTTQKNAIKETSRISRPLKKLEISRNLDNIEILGQVGEGTYGKVFKAFHKNSKIFVALKKMVLKEEEKGKDKHKDGVTYNI